MAPTEAVKADYDILVNVLHELFRKIWNIEEIPEGWKRGYIIKFPRRDIKRLQEVKGHGTPIPGKETRSTGPSQKE